MHCSAPGSVSAHIIANEHPQLQRKSTESDALDAPVTESVGAASVRETPSGSHRSAVRRHTKRGSRVWSMYSSSRHTKFGVSFRKIDDNKETSGLLQRQCKIRATYSGGLANTFSPFPTWHRTARLEIATRGTPSAI